MAKKTNTKQSGILSHEIIEERKRILDVLISEVDIPDATRREVAQKIGVYQYLESTKSLTLQLTVEGIDAFFDEDWLIETLEDEISTIADEYELDITLEKL